MKPQLLTELLNKAKEEELGLAIETTNAKQLSIQLDNHKRWLDEFEGLMICLPSIEGHVFIIHKSVELDGPSI